MNAKNYLQQIKKIDLMIQNKIMEVEQLKAIAMSTTASMDGERVQTSGSHQKMADAVARYVDMEKDINTDIDKLIAIKKEIIKTLERLPALEYDILHKKYVQGMELADMSIMLDKSYSWLTTVHGRGLEMVQAELNKVK